MSNEKTNLKKVAKIMRKISKLVQLTNCYLMIFDNTYQVTDCDTDESYDFDTPEKALNYLENKKEYLEKVFELINS